jgi:hypothetical protein
MSMLPPSVNSSVGDPELDPQDPHVFGPSVSGSICQRCWSGSGSFPFLINVLSGLKLCLQYTILMQNFSKILNFLDWRWCTCGQVMRKKCGKKNNLFCILKNNEERSRIRSWSGSRAGTGYGSIIQRYGSGDPEPDPHQNVTDTQHWYNGEDWSWEKDPQIIKIWICLRVRYMMDAVEKESCSCVCRYQYSGSVTFDPYRTSDVPKAPAQDPALFVSGLQDTNK